MEGRTLNLRQLQTLVAPGESDRVEFKKSTGDLKGGMETLCGFLNGRGGRVLFGVTSGGRILGQTISDATLREVANEITRLEPPATITQSRVSVSESDEVLILETTVRSSAPYTYNGRPFQRVGTITSPMRQAEYERRLLERGHSQQRWENQIASGYRLRDLDVPEIRRTVAEAIDAGRLETTVESSAEVLRKLHMIRERGVIQAAVVAFAREVLPEIGRASCRERVYVLV